MPAIVTVYEGVAGKIADGLTALEKKGEVMVLSTTQSQDHIAGRVQVKARVRLHEERRELA